LHHQFGKSLVDWPLFEGLQPVDGIDWLATKITWIASRRRERWRRGNLAHSERNGWHQHQRRQNSAASGNEPAGKDWACHLILLILMCLKTKYLIKGF
jgi:hypothetical protein